VIVLLLTQEKPIPHVAKRLTAIAKSIVEMSDAIPAYAQFNDGERMFLHVCMQLVRPISTAKAARCTTSVMIVLRGTLILASVPACPTGPSLLTDAIWEFLLKLNPLAA